MHYPLLLALNAALAALLAALVSYQLVVHGATLSRARFRHAAHAAPAPRFAVLAVVPGLIVYAVSVQFLTRSIESWFDVKVDAALEGGINLGQQAIDQMMLELQSQGAADGGRACRQPAAAARGASRAAARPGRSARKPSW